jgi:hypothetical protein
MVNIKCKTTNAWKYALLMFVGSTSQALAYGQIGISTSSAVAYA